MKANTYKWYKDRLLAMSFLELIWRINLFVKKKWWKITISDYSSLRFNHKNLISDENAFYISNDSSAIISEANKYLSHDWLFFGLENCSEKKINWHLDPVSQISAPIKFGFDINHRDEHLVGNIKNTWEKNRHHNLTILAQAYSITKEDKYAIEVNNQLRDWIKNNPYLIGVNWTHPLEQGIRLISWVYIYRYLKGWDQHGEMFGENGYMWQSIYDHQKFIENTYSRGSSANNHLIGEMAGLFISSVEWPVFNDSGKWSRIAKGILEKEMLSQNYGDGVNKELGFSYQLFVAQFGVLCVESEDCFSKEYKVMLSKMLDFIGTMKSILGDLPNYGDGDEGMALQLDPLDTKQLGWLSFYSKEHLAYNSDNKLDDCFISNDSGIAAFRRIINGNEVSVLFDYGPLGMGSMAAHGHADALSFILNVNSSPFFVDPGTFCYHDDLAWRAYFRGTKAHNTISIDGEDQSTQSGPFLWSKKAECTLEEVTPSEFYASAFHDGYANLNVQHKRSISLNEEAMLIDDILEGDEEHDVELRFHLHPSINLDVVSEGILLIGGTNRLLLSYDNQLVLSILEGEDSGGWYSPIFGIKVKSKTIVLSQRLSLPARINTKIEIQ